jgi:hypothetical protein
MQKVITQFTLTSLQNWRDTYGLLCFIGSNGLKDGGDTCANEFTALYCLATLKTPQTAILAERALSQLVVAGIPRRHPDPAKWYCSTNRTSRDQYTPYLCYLLADRKPQYAKHALWARLKHGFLFTWNTRRNFQYPTLAEHLAKSTPDVKHNYRWKLPDLTLMDIWALELRLLRKLAPIPVSPLLYVLDAYSLLNCAFSIIRHRIKPDYDRRNLTLKLHASAHHTPTLLSKLTWYIYKKSKVGADSATKWWTQAGEPPLHQLVLQLF